MADDDEQVLDAYLQGKQEGEEEQQKTDDEIIEEYADKSDDNDKEESDNDEESGNEEDDKGKAREQFQKIVDAFSQKRDQVAAWPTPGGIGLLLLAIFVILWTLVPTKSGYTRMQLLWMVLHDEVQLKNAQYPSGSSGDWGQPDPAFTPTATVNPVSLMISQFAGGSMLPSGVPDFGAEV